jgi:hypothetical protein
MRAVAEEDWASPRKLVFRIRAGAHATPPLPFLPPLSESNLSRGQQHCTTAACIAIGVTALSGLAYMGTTWHFRSVDSEAKASHEHVDTLIHDQLNPAADKINDHIHKKVESLSQKIDALSVESGVLLGNEV